MIFSDLARARVRIPLATVETGAISQTPVSPHNPERRNRNEMGNTNVPNSDTRKDRAGLSKAVKKEEKHMSIQPAR